MDYSREGSLVNVIKVKRGRLVHVSKVFIISKYTHIYIYMPPRVRVRNNLTFTSLSLSQPVQEKSRARTKRKEKMKKTQLVLRREDSSTNSASTVRSVRYGECQKNHAAGIGGYAVDGCREFMASGEEETDGALTCAACGCHRSFHRRQVQSEVVCDYSSSNET